jgi:hypothetical protein
MTLRPQLGQTPDVGLDVGTALGGISVSYTYFKK